MPNFVLCDPVRIGKVLWKIVSFSKIITQDQIFHISPASRVILWFGRHIFCHRLQFMNINILRFNNYSVGDKEECKILYIFFWSLGLTLLSVRPLRMCIIRKSLTNESLSPKMSKELRYCWQTKVSVLRKRTSPLTKTRQTPRLSQFLFQTH